MVHGEELGAARGVLQRDGDDLALLDAHHHAVFLLHDEVRRGGAELRGDVTIRSGLSLFSVI